MHKRLLGEETLTLKKAVEVAAGMEAAAKSAQDFKATETTVAQVVPEVHTLWQEESQLQCLQIRVSGVPQLWQTGPHCPYLPK